jgi:hypothetical protein
MAIFGWKHPAKRALSLNLNQVDPLSAYRQIFRQAVL